MDLFHRELRLEIASYYAVIFSARHNAVACVNRDWNVSWKGMIKELLKKHLSVLRVHLTTPLAGHAPRRRDMVLPWKFPGGTCAEPCHGAVTTIGNGVTVDVRWITHWLDDLEDVVRAWDVSCWGMIKELFRNHLSAFEEKMMTQVLSTVERNGDMSYVLWIIAWLCDVERVCAYRLKEWNQGGFDYLAVCCGMCS